MKEVPTSSLPRERMEIYGAEALSDQELLAILLRTGQHPHSVMSIAGNLLKTFGGLASLLQATLHELEEIRGIGRVNRNQSLDRVRPPHSDGPRKSSSGHSY